MKRLSVLALLLAAAPAAMAATYGDLSAQPDTPPPAYAAGPYAEPPMPGACPQCGHPSFSGGPQGVMPAPLDAPGAAQLSYTPPERYLPFSRQAGLPHGRLQVWSFGQINSTTDPFNQIGLSTPFMFVPWSTPLSGWTNAQTWNWWRERSGVQPPYW
ncbi:MAG: hypothetical protein KGL46_05550 [Hyphomicrobiales bacterium]|nr:hypothetical protein [Hyphomicrobiales bacterium]